MCLLIEDVFNEKVTFDIPSSSEGRISSYTLLQCYLEIYTFKKNYQTLSRSPKRCFQESLKVIVE